MSSTTSSQWEVVTKSRKHKNLEKKVIAHTEQKRLAAKQPKLEELLPAQQYRNLLLNKNNNNNKQSPAKSTSSSSKSKSPIKKNPPKASKASTGTENGKKAATAPKASTKPKSLEQAMRLITAEDFESQVTQLQLSFPGSELRWLSNIAGYFNSNLAYDSDPIFSGKSVYYPSNLASAELKRAIVDFLGSVGINNLEYFFHSLIDSMASEMNNNLHVVGYKFLLQVIGQNWPSICAHNLARTALLRVSYQNRSNICLSIHWAVGQCGYQSLEEGIKVWQNLMFPNLELKHYTKFVVEYVEKILATAKEQTLNLNQIEFFQTYNALNGSYINIARDLQHSLKRSAAIFLQKYIENTTKHANIFLILLREISSTTKHWKELEGCIKCLLCGGEDSFKVWRMNYKKQTLSSLLLLQTIAANWEKYTFALAESTAFHDFLKEAAILNSELDNVKRRDENVDALIVALQSVQEKSSTQQKRNRQNSELKKKCGCCKWVLGSILLLALIGGSICYDTQVNGKGVFERSATGKILKNAGLLPHVQKAWYTTMSASARGYKWAEENVPPYAKPAIQLSCDLFKLTRNSICNTWTTLRELFNAKWPAVAKALDSYVPGVSKKLELYANGAGAAVSDVYVKSLAFFKTQVLVGRFSPENLHKALNETQNVAREYYVLFQKKVDAYAKLK